MNPMVAIAMKKRESRKYVFFARMRKKRARHELAYAIESRIGFKRGCLCQSQPFLVSFDSASPFLSSYTSLTVSWFSSSLNWKSEDDATPKRRAMSTGINR